VDRVTRGVVGFRGIGIATRQAALLAPLPPDHSQGPSFAFLTSSISSSRRINPPFFGYSELRVVIRLAARSIRQENYEIVLPAADLAGIR